MDPLAEKFLPFSPYVAMGNNPVVFLDRDGKENTIYLQLTKDYSKDFSWKEVKAMVRQANVNFYLMKMNTRVKISKGDVDLSKFDKTDAIAILGRPSSVIQATKRISPKFAEELSEASSWNRLIPKLHNSANPEKSEINGNVIAINSQQTAQSAGDVRLDKASWGAYLINHGAGHLAGITVHGNQNWGSDHIPYSSVMRSGEDLVEELTSAFQTKTAFPHNEVINSPANRDPKGIIQTTFRDEFGTKPSNPRSPTVSENEED